MKPRSKKFCLASLLASSFLSGCASPLGNVHKHTPDDIRRRLDSDYVANNTNDNHIQEQFYERIDPMTGKAVYVTPSVDKLLLKAFREQRKYILKNYEPGHALYGLMKASLDVEKEFDEVEEWVERNFDVSDVDLNVGDGIVISFSIPWGGPYRKGRIIMHELKPSIYLDSMLSAK